MPRFKRRRRYYKRRGRNAGPYRRKTRPRTGRQQFRMMRRNVRTLLNSRELKIAQGSIDWTATADPTVVYQHDFFQIDTGDAAQHREGNFITLRSVEVLVGVLAPNGVADVDLSPTVSCRQFFAWTKNPGGFTMNTPSGTAGTFFPVLFDTTNPRSMFDPSIGVGMEMYPTKVASRHLYKLRKNKVYILSAPGAFVSQSWSQVAPPLTGALDIPYGNGNHPNMRFFKYYLSFPRGIRLQYAGNAAGLSPMNLLLTFCWWSSREGTVCRGYQRVRFWDS